MSLASALATMECLAALEPSHSALQPAGPQAKSINDLWWWYFAVCGAIYLVVMVIICLAFWLRRGKPDSFAVVIKPPGAGERRNSALVIAAVALTVLVLFGLLGGEYATGRAIHQLNQQPGLKVKIVGRQWWWEIHYEDGEPSDYFTTAGELHLPVGRPVEIQLESHDVIHSLWIPNLHGKRDLVPGHPTRTVLQATREGRFVGQCAEYCGLQHAKMRLDVVVDPAKEFEDWLGRQRQPAAAPQSDAEQRGQRVFLTHTCVMCHTIQGTLAGSKLGPDLTHVASRFRIASASLENNRGHLAGWVSDAQSIKPGIRMPPNPLEPVELQNLLDYLSSLK